MGRCNLSLGLAALLVFALTPATSLSEPYRPADPGEVVEVLPPRVAALARAARALRSEENAAPAHLSDALELAWRYVALAREESDPRYEGLAEGIIGWWLVRDEPRSEVLLVRAVLRQRRHDFTGALADLADVLRRDPRNSRAWLVRAMIQMAQGDPASAERSCRPLLGRSDRLTSAVCLSYSASHAGRARAAFDFLADHLSRSSEAPAELRRFALATLADIAVRLGRPREAEECFRAALATGRDPFVLAAFADFLLARGRAAEALVLVADATRADALLLRKALAEQQLALREVRESVRELEQRFAAVRRRGDPAHRREEARFALSIRKTPHEALRLALENFDVQREPSDARVLLEAALAAQAPRAAAPVFAWMRETGIEDVRLARLASQLEEGR